MSNASTFSEWLARNANLRGTPDYDTVLRAFEEARAQERPPVVQPAPEPGMLQRTGRALVGAGEAGLQMATGLTGGAAGFVGGAVGGVAEQILSGQLGNPQAQQLVARRAAEAARRFTYQPRTEAGQEMAGAINEVAAALPPVMPQIAAPGAILSAARQAAPAVSGAALAAQAAAQRTGAAAQRGIAAVRGMVTGGEEAAAGAPAPGRVSMGAAATPEALRRVTVAESLPAPVSLTRGAATGDPEQIAFERYEMKGPLGAPLRQRAEENNAQILQNFDILLDRSEATTPFIGPSETGRTVTGSLLEGYQAAKARTNRAYEAFRSSPEVNAQVQAQNMISFLNDQPRGLPSTNVLDAARHYAVSLGVARQENGQLVPNVTTVGQLERLRQEINNATGFTPPEIRQATVLKEMIDEINGPVAGPLLTEARRMRTEQARRYENRKLIADLLTNPKGMDDPKVAADMVFNRIVLQSSPAEITRLKRTLLTGGTGMENAAEIRARGAQAWKEIQGSLVQHIRDRAASNIQQDSRGLPIVSAKKLNDAVSSLDRNRRLDIVLGKQTAATIRDINDVVKDISNAPPGTLINTSDTARTLMNAMGEMALTGSVSGVPVPVITGIKHILRLKRENVTKKRIYDALNALPQEPTQSPGVAP